MQSLGGANRGRLLAAFFVALMFAATRVEAQDSSSTSTSTSSTTSTSLPPGECGCDGFGFLVDDLAKINNDGWVDGNLGVNQVISGLLRLGKRVFLTDGTVIAGQRVKLGDETSVYDVSAVSLFRGITSIVRGSFDVAVLPLRVPFCELPVFACTPGNDVTVADATTIALTPGSYGALVVGNGATLTLDPNADYTFCSIRIGRGSLVESLDRTTINVVGDVSIGAGSKVWTPPVVNDLPLILNVGGTKIKISQFAILEAAITAPLAKLKMQRQAQIYGCFCTDTLTTDKEVLLECVDTTGGP